MSQKNSITRNRNFVFIKRKMLYKIVGIVWKTGRAYIVRSEEDLMDPSNQKWKRDYIEKSYV